MTDWTLKNPDTELFTTTTVVEEVRNRPSQSRIDNLLSLGRLIISDPNHTSIVTVRDVASKSGDASELSETDVELLALARDLRTVDRDVTVVSTDLALLNTAIFLHLDIIDPTGRMQYRIDWMFVCPACRHQETAITTSIECPICGTPMRRKTKKKKRLP